MALVSVKLTAADKKAQKDKWSEPYEGDDFPYGLTIDLDDRMVRKLGLNLKDFPLDAKVEVTATAYVKSTSENKRNGKEERSMCLQIEALEVVPDSAAEDVGETMYKGDD